MFGISFGEIFIILLVSFILIKPEDLPIYIKEFKKVKKKFYFIKKEILGSKTQIQNMFDEEKMLDNYTNKINEEITEILGEDGKIHTAYPKFIENRKTQNSDSKNS